MVVPFVLCPHGVFVIFCVFRTAIIFPHNILGPLFVMKVFLHLIFCELRIESLYLYKVRLSWSSNTEMLSVSVFTIIGFEISAVGLMTAAADTRCGKLHSEKCNVNDICR